MLLHFCMSSFKIYFDVILLILVFFFRTNRMPPSLLYLDIFGLMREESIEILSQTFPKIGFNKFIHSSVARPTVGNRRTSIWGLRTRD